MNLTQKEINLLSDLKGQEQLCVEKYTKYMDTANDPCLKNIFENIKNTEATHLATITKIMNGEQVAAGMPPSAADSVTQCRASEVSEQQKKDDAFLCKDALSMEKHVSSLYDTCIFEFPNPALRDALAHIQKEEQNHGEMIYSYMAKNGMYSG